MGESIVPMAFLFLHKDGHGSYFPWPFLFLQQRKENQGRMNAKNHKPLEVSSHLFQLGTPAFPAYLSIGEEGMIIEGGTGPTFLIMIDQMKFLGINLRRIKYIVLTHTHPDHIGAVPHFQRAWPHIKLLTSSTGAKILGKTDLFKQFQLVDLGIAQLMKAKGEIHALPEPIKDYTFKVDSVIKEGDRIDLGAGIAWHIYDTPGHSPCHIALFEEKEKTLALGDATGFYVPEKDVFWPNYFESLDKYCDSIRRLARLPAKRGILSHNGVVERDVPEHLKRAMQATEKYHHELMGRLNQGEPAEKIAMEKARFVDSLTDIQPFKIIYDLCEVMIKNSLANGKEDLFAM